VNIPIVSRRPFGVRSSKGPADLTMQVTQRRVRLLCARLSRKRRIGDNDLGRAHVDLAHFVAPFTPESRPARSAHWAVVRETGQSLTAPDLSPAAYEGINACLDTTEWVKREHSLLSFQCTVETPVARLLSTRRPVTDGSCRLWVVRNPPDLCFNALPDRWPTAPVSRLGLHAVSRSLRSPPVCGSLAVGTHPARPEGTWHMAYAGVDIQFSSGARSATPPKGGGEPQ
jgi:hypothetical protein